MTSPTLAGQAVAIVSAGGGLARAVTVACAEGGASLGLATLERTREQEFAVNSIGNEAWAIGREQFVRPLDGTAAAEMASFADEVCDRFKQTRAAILVLESGGAAPFEELSESEWEAGAARPLTAGFLLCQSFGRNMQRDGGGLIAVVSGPATNDVALSTALAGLEGLLASMEATFRPQGVALISHRLNEANERSKIADLIQSIGTGMRQGI